MITEVSVSLARPGATLYLLDFNFYIGTRTFIGSILTLLTPHITYQQIFQLNICIYLVLILMFMFLGFYTFKKSMSENNNILFLSSLLFITSPYALLQYANWIGTYDVYLCLFAVLCSLTSLSKRAHYLLPILCVMAIFTHYAFVFSYLPAVLAVHIYNITISKNKKSRIFSTSTAFIASFIVAVYCGFFANDTIKMSRTELYTYMENRLGIPIENKPYIDSYYFNDDVFDMLKNFKDSIINQEFLKNFILFFLPLILLFASLWCYYIIKAKKDQIISGFFFLAATAVSILLIFFIVEAPRWQTAATLSQFIIFFVLIKKEDTFILDILSRLNNTHTNILLFLLVILNVFASFAIKPYFS